MGVLVDGKWRDEQLPAETGKAGEFNRTESIFRDRITADGSSGYKAEAGRYHLYVAHQCPWAHRTLIYLAIKKLDGAISVAAAIPHVRDNGWTFEKRADFPECTPDTVNGFHYLYEAYAACEPHYTGKVTVPTLWDKKTKRIVNNEFVRNHPHAQQRVQRHRRRRHRLLSGRAARRDRPHERVHLRQHQQRRLSQPASPPRRRATRRPMTSCSRRSTNSKRGSGASAISSAIASPRRTGGCSRRCCASMSPISRCSSATGSASPIIRT